MNTIQRVATIGEDGRLHLDVPLGQPGDTVELVIVYTVKKPISQEDWQAVLDRTYGSMADNPLDEVEQLPLEKREEVE